MNIQSYLEVCKNNVDEHNVEALLRRRRDRFLSYCETEKHRGGLDPDLLLTSPQGQENIRILFARCIEEILEAINSEEVDHYKEELIDALNFGTSLLFLLPENRTDQAISHFSESLAHLPENVNHSESWWPERLLLIAAQSFNGLLETLRNRPWQNRTQQPYFTGAKELESSVTNLWFALAGQFEDWTEFCTFYLAKDEVLSFRIKTKY